MTHNTLTKLTLSFAAVQLLEKYFKATVLQRTHSDVLQPFKTALQLCIPDSSDLHVDQALITVLLHCNGREVLVL